MSPQTLAICEARDPKGLYRQARASTLRNFTGIDAVYEAPESPELMVDTAVETVEQSLQRMVDSVARNFPLVHRTHLASTL
jgi:adenylylsulfate kinase-like enzyme